MWRRLLVQRELTRDRLSSRAAQTARDLTQAQGAFGPEKGCIAVARSLAVCAAGMTIQEAKPSTQYFRNETIGIGANFSRPCKNSSSIRNCAATRTPPTFLISVTADADVPPVA